MADFTTTIRDRSSFENAFGPIKRIGAANNALRQCRMPGENYYTPKMEATPRMFGARLWTTGFHPATSDGTDIDDWRALAEAVRFARKLARALKGVVISSDTDCPYYPFVFPRELDGNNIAKHVHAGLGCKTKTVRDFCVEKSKQPETFFWDEDDDPEDYYSPGEVVRCRKAAALLRRLGASWWNHEIGALCRRLRHSRRHVMAPHSSPPGPLSPA
jgi:hypothetical protein